MTRIKHIHPTIIYNTYAIVGKLGAQGKVPQGQDTCLLQGTNTHTLRHFSDAIQPTTNIWTGGGNLSSRRKPQRHWENAVAGIIPPTLEV